MVERLDPALAADQRQGGCAVATLGHSDKRLLAELRQQAIPLRAIEGPARQMVERLQFANGIVIADCYIADHCYPRRHHRFRRHCTLQEHPCP